MVQIAHEQYSKDPSGFEKLLNDVEQSLYEGCKKFTKLSTLVKLYNLKVRYGWSNISFSKLLKALKDILPSPNDLSTSMYEAKKMLVALGMKYEKIHACPNHCCLYRKEYANTIVCSECSESREIEDKLRHRDDSLAWNHRAPVFSPCIVRRSPVTTATHLLVRRPDLSLFVKSGSHMVEQFTSHLRSSSIRRLPAISVPLRPSFAASSQDPATASVFIRPDPNHLLFQPTPI
ncbi:transposase [Cucumis melo var. makuwa]|uniref:Transposase n=1 Tax=Cucumis melo var. makuwa TaxID=1194695 RepID=A0A5A7T9S6_CUCMM|nr:transposase [Cucumis melo var. makuwa]